MPHPMIMSGYYDPILVALSIAVAIFASFTALSLAGRLLAADNRARLWWSLGGVLSIGRRNLVNALRRHACLSR